MAKLNNKQERFANEYCVDLNATQAAIRAGYSLKTARQIGQRLLSNVDIQEKIQQIMQKRERRTEITQDRVLQEFAKIAFFDPRKLFDENGNPKPITDLDDITAGAIAGLDVVTDITDNEKITYTKKYKISDKLRALESVGRHLGMFDGNNGNSDALEKLDSILGAVRDNAFKRETE